MSDPLSIGVSIVTIIQLTSKLVLKAKSFIDIPECIQQVVTEAESFRLVIVTLRELLIQINHYNNSPNCPGVDAQALLYINNLALLVNEAVKTLERLDKVLDGMIIRKAAAEGDGLGESRNRDLGERVNVTKTGVGKWIWNQDDIRIHLQLLESQKGNLNIIIGILNCHEITQTKRAQAQQFHLLMRAIQGSAVGSHPQWERLLEHGTTTDSESSGSVDHLGLAVNNAQQTSSALVIVPTVRRQGWGISSTASNARNPLSEAASKLILNASFASVEDGNFLKALFASRVYARVSRRSTSSGDDMTISEYNLSGRSLFSYRLERRSASLPLAALVSSPSAVFNPTKQVEIFHKYIARGSIETTRALLEYGVDVQATNKYGQTPLYVASEREMQVVQNVDMIKLLLEYGADVNAPNLNSDGRRALHGAIAATTSSDAGASDAVNLSMDIVRLLLAHGAEIEASDSYELRPLHMAADKGHTEVVKLLLEQGAQIEAPGRYNQCPLHRAADKGHMEVVKLLLERGAQIEAPDRHGQRPLHMAADKGHMEVVKLLLERSAQIEAPDRYGQRPLRMAADKVHTGVVKLLLERGAQIEAPDIYGQRPLQIAADKGHTEVVKLLLEQGAQIEAPDRYGQRPLHMAADKSHMEVVKLLLEQGAQIEAPGRYGQRPLQIAADKGHMEVVKLLLERGAQIEASDEHGTQALHVAANKGHTEVVKLLLERGAQIEASDEHGMQALHVAANEGHTGVVKLLLERGAQIEASNEHGTRALQVAAKGGQTEVVKLLLEQGAQIEAPDRYGWRPLHTAVERGHTEVVKLLLEQGAQIEASDEDGKRALHLAALYSHFLHSYKPVLEILLKHGADTEAEDTEGKKPRDYARSDETRIMLGGA